MHAGTDKLERELMRGSRDCELVSKANWKGVRNGVAELRIDYGRGYRLYVGEDGTDLVLLLCGGTKAVKPLI